MMNSCAHNNLEAFYPQIWNWGIAWRCEDCGEFFFCDCFQVYLEAYIQKLLKEGKSVTTQATQFASLFPPEYTNYLVGKEIAIREFHGDQPMTVLKDRYTGDHSWVIAFLERPPFRYLHSICHVCAKRVSDQFFCADAYGSRFFQNYGAWIYRDLFIWGIGKMPRQPEKLPMHIKGKYFDSIEIPKIGYTKEYRQAMRSLVRDLENEIRRQLN